MPQACGACIALPMLANFPDSSPSRSEVELNKLPAPVFHRRVLLLVTGLSPQVVTETVFALSASGQARDVPTEIEVITTTEGARRAKLALLSDGPGWFRRLCEEYELPPIAFDTTRLLVMEGPDGAPLDDIRTATDNMSAADFITRRIRILTSDPSASVHVSIAGGRKTMGFYAGYALSLFGRPQDRLSHVLVSEPFESSWEFFYPARTERVISVAGNTLADAAKAQVTLADIPFVRLRDGLPESLLNGDATFEATVLGAAAAFAPDELVLDPSSRTVWMGGRAITLTPTQFGLYSVFAHRAMHGRAPLRAPIKDLADHEWSAEVLADLMAALGPDGAVGLAERLRAGVSEDFFSQHLSRLNAAIVRLLGARAASYRVDGGDGRPRRYRLRIEPEAIRFT